MSGGEPLIVAELGKAHGIRGEIVARLSGVTAEELVAMEGLRLRTPEGAESPVRVTRGRPRSQGGWILELDALGDRNAAEAARGGVLVADRDQLAEPEAGEWFVADLVGLAVVEEGGEELGELTEVLKLPANDVFVVHGKRGEVLLPVIDDVIVDVDLEAGRVTVRLLPGLLDEAGEEG